MDNKIIISNINFSYDKNNVIFEGTNMELKKGNIYLLTGENGSGKSTLLKIIAGLIANEKMCEIKWFGENIQSFSRLKNKVAYIKDPPYLYDYLTGRENLELLADVFEIRDDAKIYANVSRFNMEQDMDKLVKEYSVGMKYKLFLCATYCLNVDLMLFDEPFSSLDTAGQEEAMRMLDEYIKQGGIALIATHIEQYIELYGKNHYSVERRKIVYAQQ